MASDAMSTYVSSVIKYPLLSKDQEILLAREVQAWVNNPNPTPREVRRGQRAYDKLINCNLRLVISIAKRYLNRCKRTELLDLIQEGNIGLAHGIKKFDPERGYALSTYVYWWIRQAITRYLANHDRVIKLPSHALEILSKMRAWAPTFMEAHGRPPTLEECAEHCGTNVHRLEDYLARSQDASSLDRVVNSDSDLTLLDLVSDGPDMLDALADTWNREQIHGLLHHLEVSDRELIEHFFGINKLERKTFQAIGKEMGISRERVRQRFNRAIVRLRFIYQTRFKGIPV